MSQAQEAADQPPTAWQRAILQGYEVWRQLREHEAALSKATWTDGSCAS